MNSDKNTRFRLGERWVDPNASEINGVRVDARAMEVLVALMEAAPNVLSVAALLERVWPNVVVVDNVVHQAIAQLRRALGDQARSPHYIENIPRRGYRLIAEVLQEGGFGAQRGLDSPRLHTTAVAVLPFINMSNDPEQEYFSDGISEDILNELAKSTDVAVRPRSSSFSLKGQALDIPTIGQRLHVTHVLEGSVRRSGERIRVMAQLSDVRRNASVWSARFDRDLTDIFEVQDEITSKILQALNAHLGYRGTSRRFAGTEAYNAFLRGRHHLARWDFTLAAEWFERATRLDPENADAWAGLARILDIRGPRRDQSLTDHREEIDTYFHRVLTINPTNPHALAKKSQNAFFRDRDYQSSIDQLVALVNENPNDEEAHRSLSFILAAIGRVELYLQVTRRMQDVSPLSGEAMANEIWASLKIGRIEQARQALQEFSRLHNREEPNAAGWLAILDRDPGALEVVLGRNVDGWQFPFERIWLEAMVPYMKGDFARAREMMAHRLSGSGPHSVKQKHFIALIERDFDRALDHYREALESGIFFAFFHAQLNYYYRQAFPEVYEDPRFNELLRRFKLDPASTATLRVPQLYS